MNTFFEKKSYALFLELIFSKRRKHSSNRQILFCQNVQESLSHAEKQEEKNLRQIGASIHTEKCENGTRKHLPLCQDTGTAVFFVEIGVEVSLEEPLSTLSEAVAQTYEACRFRASMVNDPLLKEKYQE